MKKLLFIVILIGLISSFNSCQEENQGYKITATLEGFSENSKVVLSETGSAKILDSVRIKDGMFQFNGKLESSPMQLSIVILPNDGNQPKFTSIFIGNENVTVQGSADDFPAKLNIKGSPHQNLKSALEEKTEPLYVAYDEEIQNMLELKNQDKWSSDLESTYYGETGILTKIDNEILTVTKEFIEKHINTHYGLMQLSGMKANLSKKYIVTQLKKIDPKLKSTKYAKTLEVYLNNDVLQKDDHFYNFKAENQNGQIIEFSDFFEEEKYVLLEFYSPHCNWCKMALPNIKQLAKAQVDILKVVTFNVDKDKEDWLKTNEKNNTGWSSLWDKDGRHSETYTKYNVQGTPTYYLFNKEGKVVNKWTGFDNTTIQSIEEALN
ncbi:DUF4369 domain-containing protein [Spongiimicrobium salis]|uniref:DUF4369 domain-containing protein n=1 Tax=Spongiimicrobium salis TaxID=1667022 RepID=UPI00374DDBE3